MPCPYGKNRKSGTLEKTSEKEQRQKSRRDAGATKGKSKM
jgi:hypothetical protein